MTTVEVRVIVRDANGQDSDVTLRRSVRLGTLISVAIAKATAEASVLAHMALGLNEPLIVDRVDP